MLDIAAELTELTERVAKLEAALGLSVPAAAMVPRRPRHRRRVRRVRATEAAAIAAPSGERFRAGKRLWSADDDELLRARYPNEPTGALAEELRRTVASVYNRAKGLGIEKSQEYLASPAACRLRRGDNPGARFQFAKGHVPANKGTRRPGWAPGRMSDTQFKKGEPSRNYMPVGSTRLVDGYVYRKVSDTPNVTWVHNWTLEHRRVWEEANGPVPRAHALVFKNGDRTHVRLENLECITRRELMARNTVHNLPKELASTIQLLGVLKRQINKRGPAREKQD